MLVVASLTSIALFLTFFSIGAPRVVFNPHASSQADRLEYTKRGFQLQGALEIVLGVLLVIGLKATGSSLLAILNELAALGLLVLASLTGWRLRQTRAAVRVYGPWFALGFACLVELLFRLAA